MAFSEASAAAPRPAAAQNAVIAEHALVPTARHSAPTMTPLNIDTWEWVQTLSQSKSGSMTALQSEAVIEVVRRIATTRLKTWQAALAAQTRLQHDLHVLRTVAHKLDRLQNAAGAKHDNEQRSRYERVAAELHSVSDQLRDLLTATRTDLALLVNTFKAESREDGQKLEMELHKLEGRLTAAISAFRSDAEDTKVRSVYAFSGSRALHPLTYTIVVICVLFLTVIAERTISKDRLSKASKASEKSAVERVFL